MKYEPQSLHWAHEQISIHSGIIKSEGEKQYHPYLSEDKKHDQHFVHAVLQQMLQEVDFTCSECVVIESDNCTSQYKSSSHFHSIQQLANGHVIIPGQTFVKGSYLEKVGETRNGKKFKEMSKTAFIYKDSVVYPFINFQLAKENNLVIANVDLCEVLLNVNNLVNIYRYWLMIIVVPWYFCYVC